MTPQEQGRHCDVCSKVVKDFTKMTNEEILGSLRNSGEDVCGRVNADQLTPVSRWQKFYFRTHGTGTLFRQAVWSLLAFAGFSFTFKKSAQAQFQGKIPVKGRMSYQPDTTTRQEVKIQVVSTGNYPVQGAQIQIYSGGNLIRNFTTGPDGKASLVVLPEDLHNKEISVLVDAPGQKRKEMRNIRLSRSPQTLRITLEEEMMIMGEIAFIPEDTVEIYPEDHRDTLEQVEMICVKPEPIEVYEIPVPPVFAEQYLLLSDPDMSQDSEYLVEESLRKQNRFNVFPVPAWDYITIESLEAADRFSFAVFDNNGRKLQVIGSADQQYTLNVSQWPAGIYYVLLYINDKAVETKKVIIAK